ncbi:MAG: M23 family metallopeptidase [Anaerolineae bacterium]
MQSDPRSTHTDDTNPVRAISDRDLRRAAPIPAWRRFVGAFSLLAAMGLTAATALLLTQPPASDSSLPATNTPDNGPNVVLLPTDLPTIAPTDIPVDQTNVNPDSRVLQSDAPAPTLNPSSYGEILSVPLTSYADQQNAQDIAVRRNNYQAFTFVPDRPRSEVIKYTVQQGDTMFGIAQQFGVQPESIAWSNDRSIIGGLRPGLEINIPPVDGAYVQITADTTLQDLADRFRVDPFVIINTDFNELYGASPGTIVRPGVWIFIPGGQAETITWSAPVQRTGGSNAQSGGSGAQISFGVGEPGSCGLVDNPGGGSRWAYPLTSYVWMRGFSSYHSGVDLAVPIGTPVMAANSGSVIFSGGSNYGYGIAIVLAHGPYTTVYGHLSQTNVRCGQYVNAGQVIGLSGSTGNSSGPHLHFEIRYNDIPTDPASTMPF